MKSVELSNYRIEFYKDQKSLGFVDLIWGYSMSLMLEALAFRNAKPFTYVVKNETIEGHQLDANKLKVFSL